MTTTARTRDLRAKKRRLECDRIRVQIRHAREILAQEKVKTAALEAAMIPRKLHEQIHDAYTAMFLDGLDYITDRAGRECPHARPAIIAATEALKLKL